MKTILPLLSACILAALTGTAAADEFAFNAVTVGAPIFHRPTGDDYPSIPGDVNLSGIGSEWSYQVSRLTVDTSGGYNFVVTSNDFDIYVALYSGLDLDGGFDPADPTSGLIALSDGADGSAVFEFETALANVPLEAGKNYAFVITSFWDNINGDLSGNVPEGSFSASVSGLGTISEPTGAVPEPAAPLLAVLGSLALFRRRRTV